MASPFEIVTQTSSDLVVHSPILLSNWVVLVPLAVGLLMSAFVYTQMPKGLTFFVRNLPVWIGLLMAGLFLFTAVWSHTMILSRRDSTAVLEHRFAGFTYSTQRFPLATLERATLESARPGTRIAIVLHGGQPVWPFGKAYNPRPNEYAVIDDINTFLGHKVSVDADELERRMREKFEPEPAPQPSVDPAKQK